MVVDERELTQNLERMNRYIHRAIHRMPPHEEQLYRSRLRLLEILMRSDGLMQRDVAELLDMRPSSVTDLVDRLEKQAYIERRQDEKDQRVRRIFLTDTGRQAAVRAKDNSEDLAQMIFQCLTMEEKVILDQIVRKICDHLDPLQLEEVAPPHHVTPPKV